MDIPQNLKHKPIVYVDYEHRDEKYNDAVFLSVGNATWGNGDMSVKVWRTGNECEWSRQSEDIPMWRLLDMTTLLIATMKGNEKLIGGIVVDKKDRDNLSKYFDDNKEILQNRIEFLKCLLNN